MKIYIFLTTLFFCFPAPMLLAKNNIDDEVGGQYIYDSFESKHHTFGYLLNQIDQKKIASGLESHDLSQFDQSFLSSASQTIDKWVSQFKDKFSLATNTQLFESLKVPSVIPFLGIGIGKGGIDPFGNNPNFLDNDRKNRKSRQQNFKNKEFTKKDFFKDRDRPLYEQEKEAMQAMKKELNEDKYEQYESYEEPNDAINENRDRNDNNEARVHVDEILFDGNGEYEDQDQHYNGIFGKMFPFLDSDGKKRAELPDGAIRKAMKDEKKVVDVVVGGELSDSDAKVLQQVVKRYKTGKINLTVADKITDVGVIVELLKGDRLKHLSFSTDSAGLIEVVQSLKYSFSLQELTISSLNGKTWRFKTKRESDRGENKKGVVKFDAIKKMTDVRAIVDLLKSNRLEKLLFSTDDEGLAKVAEVLKDNFSLQELSIRNLGLEGSRAIAKALTSNLSLQKLAVLNIEYQGVVAIVEALKSNFSLKELVVEDTRTAIDGGAYKERVKDMIVRIRDMLKVNAFLQDIKLLNCVSGVGGTINSYNTTLRPMEYHLAINKALAVYAELCVKARRLVKKRVLSLLVEEHGDDWCKKIRHTPSVFGQFRIVVEAAAAAIACGTEEYIEQLEEDMLQFGRIKEGLEEEKKEVRQYFSEQISDELCNIMDSILYLPMCRAVAFALSVNHDKKAFGVVVYQDDRILYLDKLFHIFQSEALAIENSAERSFPEDERERIKKIEKRALSFQSGAYEMIVKAIDADRDFSEHEAEEITRLLDASSSFQKQFVVESNAINEYKNQIMRVRDIRNSALCLLLYSYGLKLDFVGFPGDRQKKFLKLDGGDSEKLILMCLCENFKGGKEGLEYKEIMAKEIDKYNEENSEDSIFDFLIDEVIYKNGRWILQDTDKFLVVVRCIINLFGKRYIKFVLDEKYEEIASCDREELTPAVKERDNKKLELDWLSGFLESLITGVVSQIQTVEQLYSMDPEVTQAFLALFEGTQYDKDGLSEKTKRAKFLAEAIKKDDDRIQSIKEKIGDKYDGYEKAERVFSVLSMKDLSYLVNDVLWKEIERLEKEIKVLKSGGTKNSQEDVVRIIKFKKECEYKLEKAENMVKEVKLLYGLIYKIAQVYNKSDKTWWSDDDEDYLILDMKKIER